MSSGQVLRQVESMVRDPRIRAISMQDIQNILTAIDVCALGFNRGAKVAEDLDLLLAAEWPPRRPTQKSHPQSQFL
jgi:hypothetical protein